MATFTTRLGLRKPADIDLVSQLTDLNANFDKIDTNIGAVLCTSTTRPTGGSLFTGLSIFETDTKKSYVYDGATWRFVGVDGAWTTYTPSFTNVSGGTGSGAEYAFQLAGKTLRLRGSVPTSGCTATAAGICSFSLPSGLTPAGNQGVTAIISRTLFTGLVNQGTSDVEVSTSSGGNFTAGQSLSNLRWSGVVEVL